MRPSSRFRLATAFSLLLMLVVGLMLSGSTRSITHAAAPTKVTIPSMKLPWDKSISNIPLTGGPFGNIPDKTCTLEHLPIMSGVDFGLPQNTAVLAVAAGKIIYAGYTNNEIRNEVRIDHGGGFVTEYWGLNSIDSSIVVGESVAQGKLLGLSGYTPCPNCKNGISVHLRLEFRQYTSNPLVTTPLSAQKMPIDGYTIWAFVNAPTNQGYNFQGTMTIGLTIVKYQTECGVNNVKTWYSRNGPTVLAVPNGTGGYLTSTNSNQVLTDWPMFGFDLQGTHFNPYENVLNSSNVSNLTLNWKASTGLFITTSPVVVNGVVYISSEDGHLYAFNAITGAGLWISVNGGGPDSPVVSNGVVYVSSQDNSGTSFLYAFNAATGQMLWASPLGGVSQSPPIVVNGVLYIGAQDNKVYAFNATTGTLLWSYTVDSYVSSSPAFANGLVYVSSGNGTLYALNSTTGAFIWNDVTGDQTDHSSPAVVNGVVYLGSANNLYAFNATTGASIWTVNVGNRVIPVLAVSNGVVYYGSKDVYAFDAQTGTLLWTALYSGSFITAVSVANGVVYADSYQTDALLAYDAQTGIQLWSYTTGGYIFSSPAVVNGAVYVGSFDSNVYAFHLPGTHS